MPGEERVARGSNGRKAAGAAAFVVLALAAAAAGAFVADPLPVNRRFLEERLWRAHARRETFPGPNRERLSVWELGPLSAEVPVVLQHGLGADATYFAKTAIALHRETGRTVLVPDAPGSGRSEAPADGAYGLASRVAALDALWRALALEKADVVGHSLGGWTAAAFALASPSRVGRLVLADSGGFTDFGGTGVDAARRRFLPTDRSGARDLVAMLFLRKGLVANGFVADALARAFRSGTPARTVAALKESDLVGPRVQDLPAGTVFLWGAHDAVFPLADARRAAAQVAGARLLVVTGTGHDPALEAPRAFRKALVLALQ